jgi:pyruvyltransferase
MAIVLKQFSGFANVGDRLSPLIVERVTGRAVRVAGPEPLPQVNLVAVGSILHFADMRSVLWSCGAIDPQRPFQLPRRVLAVRGLLTRELLTRRGVRCPDVLGDGAALAPALFAPAAGALHDVGFVPHHRDRESEFVRRCSAAGFTVLDVGRSPADFVAELTSCTTIVSSSLHGIVLAHAYGIPAAWISLSRIHRGGLSNEFKFLDYYSSIGVAAGDVPRASESDSLTKIVAGAFRAPSVIDAGALRSALSEAAGALDGGADRAGDAS